MATQADVRAALADEIESETGYDRVYCEKLAGKAYTRLVQMGTLRVEHVVCISRADVEDAALMADRLCELEDMRGDDYKAQEYGELADRLRAVLQPSPPVQEG